MFEVNQRDLLRHNFGGKGKRAHSAPGPIAEAITPVFGSEANPNRGLRNTPLARYASNWNF